MTIPRHQIEALKAFGYTEDEAQFLYLVATHSGYFLARQFLNFVGAKRGYRTHSLTQKLITQGHATMREYRRNGCIYHLYSRKLYAQIGRENLRNRRRHRLEAIKTRLLSLDFILANQGYQYLESEPEKVAYFTEELRIPEAVPSGEALHGWAEEPANASIFRGQISAVFQFSRLWCSPCGHIFLRRSGPRKADWICYAFDSVPTTVPRAFDLPAPLHFEHFDALREGHGIVQIYCAGSPRIRHCRRPDSVFQDTEHLGDT